VRRIAAGAVLPLPPWCENALRIRRAVLARLGKFLPSLQKANAELEQVEILVHDLTVA
jgi:hypothetical protein